MSRRAWRRRSRRGQVAAVATILGLLLVVTFIANFLTTTLPNTMGQNDLKHDVQVQNQVAQLSAQLQEFAQSNVVGGQISQPITLGSHGAPPFAGQDGSSIMGLANRSTMTVTASISGPTTYSPPGGFGLSKLANLPAVCNPRPPTTTLTCGTHKGDVYAWNFSAGDGLVYTVTMGTGSNLVKLNFATNGSSITVSGISGMPTYIQIIGTNDTLAISNNGGGNNPLSVNITGSYDTISAGSFPGGASTIYVHVIGDHDIINGDSTAGGNNMYVSILGTADTLALTPGGGDNYYTYFTGFDPLNLVSPFCPYGALAHNDSVTGYTNAIGQSKNAHLFQTYNNSTAYPGNSTHNPGSRWSITNQTVTPYACPFVTAIQFSATPSSGSSGFVVQLRNTYAPSAEVALDQGAVVYAQPGGIPVFIVPPRISYANGVLQLFVPTFVNQVNSEAGVGTADLAVRLISTPQLILPANQFSLTNGSTLTITIVTHYAAAWLAYLQQSSLAPYVTCTSPPGVNVCTAVYNANNPVGTIQLAIPASGLKLNLLVGVFAFSLA